MNKPQKYNKRGLDYVISQTDWGWSCIITGKGATGYGWAPRKEDAVIAAETDWNMSAGEAL